ncbi:MAG: RIP metalloprotease RseP [Alphaproteobacteria bacterium]|nr:RIP metalloprotease RseP [Alphaproteobacteria bacterium]
MSGVLTQGPLFIICLVVMLGIVVVIHELGHYLAGRAFGAAAESFSVGFGSPIFERKDKRNTRWRINWVPLGGFVKFVGEPQAPGDVGRLEDGPVGKAYNELGPGARSVVALAGPAANFLLAIVLFGLIFWATGSPRERLAIVGVEPGGPAAEAGLMAGDRIAAVDGEPLENRTDLLLPVQLGSGDPLELAVLRNGEEVPVTVVPERRMRENGVGQQQPLGTIGVEFRAEPLERQSYNPASALLAGVSETGQTVSMTVDMIGRMLTGRESISTLSGPVGIGDVTRRVVNRTMEADHVGLGQRLQALGWTALRICALVSVGIGLFNLLPLPVLDGGHLVFNAYEAVTGKALPEKIQEASLTAGLIVLIGLFVVVTWSDILETGVFSATGN